MTATNEPPAIIVVTEIISKRHVNHHWLCWKREQAGLKLYMMADQIGVSAQHLGKIERGMKPCPERIRLAYEQL